MKGVLAGAAALLLGLGGAVANDDVWAPVTAAIEAYNIKV